MNELEGMINGLLSNPEEMQKIMDIANSVMESSGTPSGGVQTPAPASAAPDGGGMSGLGSLLGNMGGLGGLGGLAGLGSIAPALGRAAKSFIGGGGQNRPPALGAGGDKAALIDAMKPFLSESRRGKLDRASQMAKMMSMGLSLFGGRGRRT